MLDLFDPRCDHLNGGLVHGLVPSRDFLVKVDAVRHAEVPLLQIWVVTRFLWELCHCLAVVAL